MPEVDYVGSQALLERGMAALRQAVAESAETLASAAQERAPVDTGTLRASIHVEKVEASGLSVAAEVSTGGEANEYALYQEVGTSKMAAQPYMTPALVDHANLHRQVCEKAWEDAF